MTSPPQLHPETLARLTQAAAAAGLIRLGVVSTDHPAFADAAATFDQFIAAGRQGEMEFLTRSADTRRDPSLMLVGARTLLVAAVPYRGEPGPVARYAQTLDYHTEMHRRLAEVAKALAELVPGVESVICVDTKPIFERTAAALAGLGFIGKHGCVIVPQLGSYVFLGAILCTAKWSGPDAVDDLKSARWEACGACTRCLDACPTQAFVGPGELDPRRCISYLTLEHRGPIDDVLADRMGERIAGCDVCQEVCPYNASPQREARVARQFWLADPGHRIADMDLQTLVDLGSAGYRKWVKHTALRRVPRKTMARNALVALANADRSLSPAELERIGAVVEHPDPEIARAARRLLERRRRGAAER